jgi:hypothetical protein
MRRLFAFEIITPASDVCVGMTHRMEELAERAVVVVSIVVVFLGGLGARKVEELLCGIQLQLL